MIMPIRWAGIWRSSANIGASAPTIENTMLEMNEIDPTITTSRNSDERTKPASALQARSGFIERSTEGTAFAPAGSLRRNGDAGKGGAIPARQQHIEQIDQRRENPGRQDDAPAEGIGAGQLAVRRAAQE